MYFFIDSIYHNVVLVVKGFFMIDQQKDIGASYGQ